MIIIFLLFFTMVSVIASETSSLILVKLPRSGSTYLTDLLNHLPWLYLSKEIVQTKDSYIYPVKEIEDHLRLALIKPTEKIAFKNRLLPSGRYIEDFLLKGKPFQTLHTIGFSINLEHVKEANWTNILQGVKNPKVILYVRTNLVKIAVSAVRGEMIHSSCNKSNLRVNDKQCTLPSRVNISLEDLTAQLKRWLARQTSLIETIGNIARVANLPLLPVSYELLLQNQTLALERMASFLLPATASQLPIPLVQSAWQKRTADNLTEALENYHELIESFSNSSCVMLKEMLEDVVSATNKGLERNTRYKSYDPNVIYNQRGLEETNRCLEYLSHHN